MSDKITITEKKKRNAIEILVNSVYCNDHKPFTEPIK